MRKNKRRTVILPESPYQIQKLILKTKDPKNGQLKKKDRPLLEKAYQKCLKHWEDQASTGADKEWLELSLTVQNFTTPKTNPKRIDSQRLTQICLDILQNRPGSLPLTEKSNYITIFQSYLGTKINIEVCRPTKPAPVVDEKKAPADYTSESKFLNLKENILNLITTAEQHCKIQKIPEADLIKRLTKIKEKKEEIPRILVMQINIYTCRQKLNSAKEMLEVDFDQHVYPAIATLHSLIIPLDQAVSAEKSFKQIQEILSCSNTLIDLFEKKHDVLSLKRENIFYTAFNYLRPSKINEPVLYGLLQQISEQKQELRLISRELNSLNVISELCMKNFAHAKGENSSKIIAFVYGVSKKIIDNFQSWLTTQSNFSLLDFKKSICYIALKNAIITIEFLIVQSSMDKVKHLCELACTLVSHANNLKPLPDLNCVELLNLITNFLKSPSGSLKESQPFVLFLFQLVEILGDNKSNHEILKALISCKTATPTKSQEKTDLKPVTFPPSAPNSIPTLPFPEEKSKMDNTPENPFIRLIEYILGLIQRAENCCQIPPISEQNLKQIQEEKAEMEEHLQSIRLCRRDLGALKKASEVNFDQHVRPTIFVLHHFVILLSQGKKSFDLIQEILNFTKALIYVLDLFDLFEKEYDFFILKREHTFHTAFSYLGHSKIDETPLYDSLQKILDEEQPTELLMEELCPLIEISELCMENFENVNGENSSKIINFVYGISKRIIDNFILFSNSQDNPELLIVKQSLCYKVLRNVVITIGFFIAESSINKVKYLIDWASKLLSYANGFKPLPNENCIELLHLITDVIHYHSDFLKKNNFILSFLYPLSEILGNNSKNNPEISKALKIFEAARKTFIESEKKSDSKPVTFPSSVPTLMPTPSLPKEKSKVDNTPENQFIRLRDYILDLIQRAEKCCQISPISEKKVEMDIEHLQINIMVCRRDLGALKKASEVNFDQHVRPTIFVLHNFVILLSQGKKSFGLIQEILNFTKALIYILDLFDLFEKKYDLFILKREHTFHTAFTYLDHSKINETLLYDSLQKILDEEQPTELLMEELSPLIEISELCMKNFKNVNEENSPKIIHFTYKFSKKIINNYMLWLTPKDNPRPLHIKQSFCFLALKNAINTIIFLITKPSTSYGKDLEDLTHSALTLRECIKDFSLTDLNCLELLELITDFIKFLPEFLKKNRSILSFLSSLKAILGRNDKNHLISRALLSFKEAEELLQEQLVEKDSVENRDEKIVLKPIAPSPSSVPKTLPLTPPSATATIADVSTTPANFELKTQTTSPSTEPAPTFTPEPLLPEEKKRMSNKANSVIKKLKQIHKSTIKKLKAGNQALLTKHEGEITRLNIEVNQAQQKLTQQKEKLDSLEAKYQKMQKENQKLMEENQTATDAVEKSKKDLENTTTQSSGLTEQFKKSETARAELQKKVEASKKQYLLAQSQLNKQIQGLQQTIKDKDNLLKKLVKEKENLLETQETLEREINALKAEKGSLRIEMDNLKFQNQTLTSENVELIVQVKRGESFKTNNGKLREDLTQSQAEKRKLEEKNKQLQAEIDQLRQQFTQSQAESASLHQQINQFLSPSPMPNPATPPSAPPGSYYSPRFLYNSQPPLPPTDSSQERRFIPYASPDYWTSRR